jgi:hypothetical protein
MDHYDMAVWTYGLSDSLFSHCYFEQGGIWLNADTTEGNTATALTAGHNYNNIIEKCFFKDLTASNSFYQGSNCIFRDNYVDNAWDDVLLIGSAGLNHKVYGNTMVGTSPVEGKGGSNACVYISNDDAVVAGKTAQMHHQIFGNTFRNNEDHDSGSEAGVYIINGQYIQIHENIVADCGYGIILDVTTADDISICDNDVYSITNKGVQVKPNPTYTQNNVLVCRTRFYDCDYGMVLYSNGEVSRCKVLGNIFTSCTTADLWTSVEAGKTLTALIADNSFTGTVTVAGTATNRIFDRNDGFITKNSGDSTGTGAEQTVAHGLAGTPTKVALWDIESAAGPYQSSAADATNIYVTAGNGLDWGWEAEYKP